MFMTAQRRRIRTYGKPATGKPATWPAAWRGTVADVESERQHHQPSPAPAPPTAKPLPPPDEAATAAAVDVAATTTTSDTPTREIYGPPVPVCWCCGGGAVIRERNNSAYPSFREYQAERDKPDIELRQTCIAGLLICTECEGQMQRQTDAQADQMMRRGYNDRFPRVKAINRWKPSPEPTEPAPVYRRRRCR